MLSIKPKTVYLTAALIILLVFSLDAVAEEAPSQEDKIAVINGVVITRADFDRRLGDFMARHGKRGALVRRLICFDIHLADPSAKSYVLSESCLNGD